LQHEVGWEYVFLQRGKLGAGEGAVGYDAADEGLEDGGAEEGAVAMRMLVKCGDVLEEGRYLRR
jgi:hypothetical protein